MGIVRVKEMNKLTDNLFFAQKITCFFDSSWDFPLIRATPAASGAGRSA